MDQSNRTYYPASNSDFPDFRSALKTHVLNGYVPESPLFPRSMLTITQGSCFAANIHDALQVAGIRSVHALFGEGVNTPRANRVFLEYVAEGRPYRTPAHAKHFPATGIEEMRSAITQAGLLIFTVGLIFEPTRGGEITVKTQRVDAVEWRKSSFSENVDHLRAIVSMLRGMNPDLRILLTLSPIPCGKLMEKSSAIVADCISKSTLRTAIDEVLSDQVPNVSYWPAFEAFRWLSGHMGQMYGTEGEDQRHVAPSHVRIVTEEFISAYFHAA